MFDDSTTAPARQSVIIEDVDLSEVGSGATATSLIDVSETDFFDFLFTRCKLPSAAGFTMTVGAWPEPMMGRVRLHHCSSANQTYDFYEEAYEGHVEDETTVVRTGGASNGVTAFSVELVSSANTVDGINGMESIPIHGWTDSTSSKVFTLDGIWDSASNIQNDEIWMEFEYPVDNSSGLGGVCSTKMVPLGTPADVALDDATWASGTLTNPNDFELRCTCTPGKIGPITAKVYLAKPSTTVWIDPVIREE